MPDPFSTLPLPLPLIILKSIEDLSTLNYLLKASPSANAILTRYYCAVIESILLKSAPRLQRVLRIIVSIRSQPARIRAQCASIEAFRAFHDSHIGDRPFWEHSVAGSLLQEIATSLPAVRSLLKTASQVQDLSEAFFVEYIERINKIKPYCSVGGNASATNPEVKVPDPRLCRYEIVPVGEPSWIEEQRVLRGLWSVVVWLDLKEVMRPNEGCQDEVWEMLAQDGPRCIWSLDKRYPKQGHEWRPEWRLQETECVLEFLYQISPGSTSSAPRSINFRSLPKVERMLFKTPKSPPSPDTYSDDRHSFSDYEADRWMQSPKFLDYESPGHAWFFKPKPLADMEPFHPYDFGPWQALGLGIWDRKKLARLGLAHCNRKRPLPGMHLVGPHKEVPSMIELVIRWKNLHCGG